MKKKPSDLYQRLTEVQPKKYTKGGKTTVVMPSPIVKKDLTDYAYGKDIDEKVIKMASQLAEKMAVSMVREMAGLNMDGLVEKVIEGVTERIAAKIPEQQTVIQQVVQESSDEIKQKAKDDFSFDSPDIAVDRSKGLELKGEIGKKTKKKGSIDEQLDALDNLL
jgi:hypothetical protein